MNNSQRAHALGQALWYDNIERRLLENGDIARMISDGIIYGITSNPSIFNNAIGKTSQYDGALPSLVKAGLSAQEIYEALAIADIQMACDAFRPLYETSQGLDGFVSLEVNPLLANDYEGTTSEASRLWNEVSRPNLMVKIPATAAGIRAIRPTIAAGINVNVTLIFSRARYGEVMDAYIGGLEDRIQAGQEISGITSVGSFFISRIDSRADALLQAKVDEGRAEAAALLGKVAIANAKLAYEDFKIKFSSDRFGLLRSRGGRVQRPLWASTSTKNPAYADTLYVDSLIGAETVNTVPPETLVAFNDHGRAESSLESDLQTAATQIRQLADFGVSLEEITAWLEQDGVEKFSQAHKELLGTIEERMRALA